jgi:hypothetical protein
MNIVSYINANTLRFIAQDEFLPEGQSSMFAFANPIAQRYGFQAHGESQTAASVGILSPAFQAGVFNFENVPVPIMSLEFLPARITATCSTSEQSNAFMDDLIEFLVTHYKFRKPSREIQKFEVSALVIDFGPQFLEKISVIGKILTTLNKFSSDASSLHAPMDIQGIRFAGTNSKHGQIVNMHYALEVRAGRPLGTNWLFSQAPLPTKSHVALLADIEAIVNADADK